MSRRAAEAQPGEGVARSQKSQEAFRTIGEAAEELGLKPHVLRFWETKFTQVRPMKRGDGRRYYRPEDISCLRLIQRMLHVEGLTIRGAQRVLAARLRAEPMRSRDMRGDDARDGPVAEGADAGLDHAGSSVRELQRAVRDAVERGDFGAAAVEENEIARLRLETLLSDLTGLKSRVDRVRRVA